MTKCETGTGLSGVAPVVMIERVQRIKPSCLPTLKNRGCKLQSGHERGSWVTADHSVIRGLDTA